VDFATALASRVGIEQIHVVGRNRLQRSAEHVNLVYLIEEERIHALDSNRIADPINRDTL